MAHIEEILSVYDKLKNIEPPKAVIEILQKQQVVQQKIDAFSVNDRRINSILSKTAKLNTAIGTILKNQSTGSLFYPKLTASLFYNRLSTSLLSQPRGLLSDPPNIFYLLEYDLFPLEENAPAEEQLIIIDESARIKTLILDIFKTNTHLHAITPREFEEIIAELLRDKGFHVELTAQTRDGGFDIIAIKDTRGFLPFKWLVECKRYAKQRPVGIEIIRSFQTAINNQQADAGLIATTSYFTSGVRQYCANPRYQLSLKNCIDIEAWVVEYARQFVASNLVEGIFH